MSAQRISAWARRFVTVSALSLVAWQAAAFAGAGRSTGVVLGVYGFVLHMVFGKAYALVPSYFDRELAVPRAPAVQFPLTVGGTAALALAAHGVGPDALGTAGGVLWAGGVAVFLGALLWTVRDNLTGADTGTSEANADRRLVDRAANAFVPVALAYLGVGSYGTLAARTPALPVLVDGYGPRVSHLLAAGAATVLVFAVGFRLLPRFLVAHPPRALVALVLPAGAAGPALVAVGLPAGTVFRAGAVVETAAVVGFAAAYLALFWRSDRRRVALYGPLAGVAAGSLGVGLGLVYALDGPVPGYARAHFRLNVLGFLGLTILGLAYQFYPPSVGSFRGASDAGAVASMAAVTGGLLVQVVGALSGSTPVTTGGEALALAGAAGYLYVLTGLFYERHGEPGWAPAALFGRS